MKRSKSTISIRCRSRWTRRRRKTQDKDQEKQEKQEHEWGWESSLSTRAIEISKILATNYHISFFFQVQGDRIILRIGTNAYLQKLPGQEILKVKHYGVNANREKPFLPLLTFPSLTTESRECLTVVLPKNVSIAVLFLSELNPSWPFMNSWLSVLGLGLSSPFMAYTPSA